MNAIRLAVSAPAARRPLRPGAPRRPTIAADVQQGRGGGRPLQEDRPLDRQVLREVGGLGGVPVGREGRHRHRRARAAPASSSRSGKAIGKTSLAQVTVGLALGGQEYAEIIFFENDLALHELQGRQLRAGRPGERRGGRLRRRGHRQVPARAWPSSPSPSAGSCTRPAWVARSSASSRSARRRSTVRSGVMLLAALLAAPLVARPVAPRRGPGGRSRAVACHLRVQRGLRRAGPVRQRLRGRPAAGPTRTPGASSTGSAWPARRRAPPAPFVLLPAILPAIGYNPAMGALFGVTGTLGMYLGPLATTTISSLQGVALYSTMNQLTIQISTTVLTGAQRVGAPGRLALPPLQPEDLRPRDRARRPCRPRARSRTSTWSGSTRPCSARSGASSTWGSATGSTATTASRTGTWTSQAPAPVVGPDYAYSLAYGFNPTRAWSPAATLAALYDSRDSTIDPYSGYLRVGELHRESDLARLVAGEHQRGGPVPRLRSPERRRAPQRAGLLALLPGRHLRRGARTSRSRPSAGTRRTGPGAATSRGAGAAPRSSTARWSGASGSRTTGCSAGVVFANAETFASPAFQASGPGWSYSSEKVGLLQFVRPAGGFGLRFMMNRDSRTNVTLDFAFGRELLRRLVQRRRVLLASRRQPRASGRRSARPPTPARRGRAPRRPAPAAGCAPRVCPEATRSGPVEGGPVHEPLHRGDQHEGGHLDVLSPRCARRSRGARTPPATRSSRRARGAAAARRCAGPARRAHGAAGARPAGPPAWPGSSRWRRPRRWPPEAAFLMRSAMFSCIREAYCSITAATSASLPGKYW